VLSFSSKFEALKQYCLLVMSTSTDFYIKNHSVIEVLTLENCAPIEIYRPMKAVYDDGVKNVRK
jgi:hypothetical protein